MPSMLQNSTSPLLLSTILLLWLVKSNLATPEACNILNSVRQSLMNVNDKNGMHPLMVSKKLMDHARELSLKKVDNPNTALQGEDSIMILAHSTKSKDPVQECINTFIKLAGLENQPVASFDQKIKVEPSGNCYWLKSEIAGAGGFGEVRIGITGTDENPNPEGDIVAIKSGKFTNSTKAGVIAAFAEEKKIYQEITANKIDGIRPLLEDGFVGDLPVLVMTRFRASLRDLRFACGGNFTVKTIVQITQQVVEILWDLHHFGWIHQDIKPDNIMVEMANSKGKSKLVLIDLGIADRYMNAQNDTLLMNKFTQMAGTLPYMGILVHQNNGPNPRNDLESLLYSMCEFLYTSFPWRGISNLADLVTRKINFLNDEIMMNIFWGLKYHIKNLLFESKPDYCFLLKNLDKMLENRNLINDQQYDWDVKLKTLLLDRNILAAGIHCLKFTEGWNYCVYAFEKFFSPLLTDLNKFRRKRLQVLNSDDLNEAVIKILSGSDLDIRHLLFTTIKMNLTKIENLSLESFSTEEKEEIKEVLKQDTTLHAGFGYYFENDTFTVGLLIMTGLQLLSFRNPPSLAIPYAFTESNMLSKDAEKHIKDKVLALKKKKDLNLLEVSHFEEDRNNIISQEFWEHEIKNTELTQMEGLEKAFLELPFHKISSTEFRQAGFATKVIRNNQNRQKEMLIVFKFDKYYHQALQVLNQHADKLKLPKISCSIDETTLRVENPDNITASGTHLHKASLTAVEEFAKKALEQSQTKPFLNVTFYWKQNTNGGYEVTISPDCYTLAFIEKFNEYLALSSKHAWTSKEASRELRQTANSLALKLADKNTIAQETGLFIHSVVQKKCLNTVAQQIQAVIPDLIALCRNTEIPNVYPSNVACIAFGYFVNSSGTLNAVVIFEYFWYLAFKSISKIREMNKQKVFDILHVIPDKETKIASITKTIKGNDEEILKNSLFSWIEDINNEKGTKNFITLFSDRGTRIHFAVKQTIFQKNWKIKIIVYE